MRTDSADAAAPHVVWLGDPHGTDPRLVGPKAAFLSRLSHQYPVPTGFCVTAAAFRSCAASLTVDDRLRAVIADAYARLAKAGTAVAVRSSAIDEDSPDASFAGQLASHLNVHGVDGVVAALEATWLSARSEPALAYRRGRDLPADMDVAVLVQRLVRADAAGVAFSLDPITGDHQRVVINATWGLGESLVNGSVDPDRYVFDKTSLVEVAAELGAKERMTVAVDPSSSAWPRRVAATHEAPGDRAPGGGATGHAAPGHAAPGHGAGTREVTTPTFLRARPALSPAERSAVARLTRDLEAQSGWPVDVEFAFGPEGLSLLQCRPVTTATGAMTNRPTPDQAPAGWPAAAEDAI